MKATAPQRIVCLAAEAADWLWRIGAWDQVVGITAFFTPPAEAAAKPKVGGFSSVRFEEIAGLRPDLVVAFSDVQADPLAELMRRGLAVLGTNQRTLAETEATLRVLGRLVGHEAEAETQLTQFRERLAPVAAEAPRPRVYFEEWNEPLISGIGWVGELIERAGGEDIFAELRTNRAASERVVSPEEVCRRDPQIILACWCGRPFNAEQIRARRGWTQISAVRGGGIFEIPAENVLQPGFRLVYGYEQMKALFARASTLTKNEPAI